MLVDEKPVEAFFWDTAGQEDFDNLRLVNYPNAECFLVCYSIIDAKSLENIKEKWVPEIEKHRPGVPIVLVATHLDKRGTNEEKLSFEDGQVVQEEIGAVAFYECSGLDGKNIKDMVFKVCQIVMARPPVVTSDEKDEEVGELKNPVWRDLTVLGEVQYAKDHGDIQFDPDSSFFGHDEDKQTDEQPDVL